MIFWKWVLILTAVISVFVTPAGPDLSALSLATESAVGAGSGSGGWETGGGDLSALRFVKIGRALAEAMAEEKPQCDRLRSAVDLKSFRQAVDKTKVSSANGDSQTKPGEIRFDRQSWYENSKEQQLRVVFDDYARATPAQASAVTDSDLLRCLPHATSGKIFGHFREDAMGSPQIFLKKFRQASASLKQIISLHAKEMAAWSIPTERLLFLIDQAQATSDLDRIDGFVLRASATPIAFSQGEMKDGRNAKIGTVSFLTLNESVWVRSSQAQRMELLFHECLGLTQVDDSRYQYSSRLWKLMPGGLYAKL